MSASKIIKVYKKGDFINRGIDEKMLNLRGFYKTEEEEIQQYSGGKGLLLGLIFLPLALLGNTKRIRVTYERQIK